MVKGNSTYHELGKTWDMPPDLNSKLEELVCQMYVSSTTTNNDNEFRYNLFCAKCAWRHGITSNYQAAIWRQRLQSQPVVPNPGHGWTTNSDGSVTIEWTQGSPAVEAVLQLMSCECACSSKLPDCVCLANQLKCTDNVS